MALEDPAPVVLVLEAVQGAAEIFDGVEVPEPEQVLFQDADEAFGAACSATTTVTGVDSLGGRWLPA